MERRKECSLTSWTIDGIEKRARLASDPWMTGVEEPSRAFAVTPFSKEFPKPRFSFRELGPGNQSSEPNPILLGNIVQNPDGGSVPEQYPLGIHSH